MTRKHHLGLLCIGLAFLISSPAMAGWGSFGGSSFGSGGSGGGSYGSVFGGSHGGSTGSSIGGASYGGSHGDGLFKRLFSHHSKGSLFGGSVGSSSGSSFGSGSGFGSTGSKVSFASSGSAFGSTGGSSGGSTGGSTGGSSGGSSGGSGLFHGGLINKIRTHHQKKMAWLRSLGNGSSGGGSSTGGSSGGIVSGGSSGGSSYGISTPIYSSGVESYPIESTPVETSYPVETGYPVESYPVESYPVESAYPVEGATEGIIESYPLGKNMNDAGALFVDLPADAKLFVNGHATTSEGTSRKFVSKGLKSGYKYPYTVKAILDIDGQKVVRTKEVQLRAGHGLDVAFDFSNEIAKAKSTKTSLTVRVPANAEVKLAGANTKAKGAKRTFTTTKLSQGQTWEDYRIVVSFKENGQTVEKEQTISLKAGEHRVLTFDFDQQVAAL